MTGHPCPRVGAGALHDATARTPAEIRRELDGRRAELDPLLASVTERFESAWYGGRPVDAVAERSFAADVATLRAGDLRPLAVRT